MTDGGGAPSRSNGRARARASPGVARRSVGHRAPLAADGAVGDEGGDAREPQNNLGDLLALVDIEKAEEDAGVADVDEHGSDEAPSEETACDCSDLGGSLHDSHGEVSSCAEYFENR